MTVEEDQDSSDNLEQRVIETLIELREDRGWSQSELARRMVEAGWPKYTQMTVSRTEKGERPIRLNEVEALARLFDVEINTLWNPRGVRLLSAAVLEVDRLRGDLERAIARYLEAQKTLAYRADALDFASQDVAEVSIMAADVLATPEQAARLVRLREAGRTTNAEIFDAVSCRTLRERVAEERFWDSPEAERSFVRLFEDINGIDTEEA